MPLLFQPKTKQPTPQCNVQCAPEAKHSSVRRPAALQGGELRGRGSAQTPVRLWGTGGCRIPTGRHKEKEALRSAASLPASPHPGCCSPGISFSKRFLNEKYHEFLEQKKQLSRPRAVTAQDGVACAHHWLLQSHLHIWHRSGRKETPAQVLDAVRVFLRVEDTDLDFCRRNNAFSTLFLYFI